MPSRRDFLKIAGGATAATLLRVDPALAALKPKPFQVPLRIPSVMRPAGRKGGRDLYVVTMRKARAQLLKGKRTPIWSFDGEFPGPTIKVKRGEPVVVRRINCLHTPTSIHLHGGKVPASSDGHPDDLVYPGERKDYHYPNAQPGATLWYHDHTHHRTSRNNYMGLNGLYIIEDEEERDLNLPKGKFDIPLVLTDRTFRNDGSFKFRDHHDEIKGKTTLVNGRPVPFLKVANRKYRFRILNASHSRGYNLQLSTRQPLVQIASDGGLLPASFSTLSLPLWPAERGEVVIDFSLYSVGTEIVLQDVDPDDPTKTRPVMRFDVAREEADDSSLPGTLRPINRLIEWSKEREFALSFNERHNHWTINGKKFDPSRIDFKPRRGDTELWTFVNNTSVTHPMHVHLVQMQVLSRSNQLPSPGEMGWKDTIRVDPASTVRVLMRFERFTGKYMMHCHNLAHEDHGMMLQMKVVA